MCYLVYQGEVQSPFFYKIDLKNISSLKMLEN